MNDNKSRSGCEIKKDNRSGFWKEFAKGIIISNPVFILTLGLCPVLAVTSSVSNALGYLRHISLRFTDRWEFIWHLL